MEKAVITMTAAERKKRRLERGLIFLAILAIICLTILQTHVVRLGAGVPTSHSVLIFAIINVNIILLFFLLILVLRNIYKLFFEEQHVIGAQLRTKLIVAFVSLTLVPTCLLFYAALQFITTGHDYWFSQDIEDSLVDSINLGEYIAEASSRLNIDFGDNIRNGIIKQRLYAPEDKIELGRFLNEKREQYNLALVAYYTPELHTVAVSKTPDLLSGFMPQIPDEMYNSAITENRPASRIDVIEGQDFSRVIFPVRLNDGMLAGLLVIGNRAAGEIKEKLKAVSDGLVGYRELKRLQDPIRVSHYIALTIVALLSIFISTWIGFHLASGITGPIMDLAKATDKIANGDYDVSIDVQAAVGEVLTLVTSFNRMTRDLKTSKEALTQKNLELEKSNSELEQRRRYMEIILQNVAAGVISTDAEGGVMTINRSAEEIFNIRASSVVGKHLDEILLPEHRAILDDLVKSAQRSYRGAVEKQIRVAIGDEGLTLHIHLSQLKDEFGQEHGMVIVFNDLTDMEKAQRMTAWREVARRIAHEIKNPLTPIQLSTQRLRRRYSERLSDDGQLFDECTLMIIRQVDELKRLVNEFSNFARMPQSNPTMNSLAGIVGETLILYEQSHKQVRFSFHDDPELPDFYLDREQIKRVLINLLDNAVAAVNRNGAIDIKLSYDRGIKTVRLEVADDGVGIKPLDKQRLFEPYFSTKKSGTGLGLAIVSTIIADHDGFVRVLDNHPRGTRFIIEMPVK